MLRRTCQQATLLMLQGQEQPLPWPDRLALRLHLLVCGACPRVLRQLALMRRASAQWRRYSERDPHRD